MMLWRTSPPPSESYTPGRYRDNAATRQNVEDTHTSLCRTLHRFSKPACFDPVSTSAVACLGTQVGPCPVVQSAVCLISTSGLLPGVQLLRGLVYITNERQTSEDDALFSVNGFVAGHRLVVV